MLIMLKWWLVAALAHHGRAAVLLPRGLGREPRALFTDYVTIDVTLDAGERAALLYANGSLVMELPAKRWAWEASPPCEPGTAARVASANVPVATGRHALQVAAVACDGAVGPLGPAQVVETVADARHLPACANVTGEEVRVVDAFVYSDERDHAATRRAELAGEVAAHVAVSADRTFRGAPRDVDTPPGVVGHIVALAAPAADADETDADFFAREGAQRDGVAEALRTVGAELGLRADDLVLVSDADEIPARRAVRRLRRAAACDRLEPDLRLVRTPATLVMSHHHYALEWTLPGPWSSAYAARAGDLDQRFGPNEGRFASLQSADEFEGVGAPKNLFLGADKASFLDKGVEHEQRTHIAEGGWHLSYFPRAVPAGAGEAGRVAAVVADLRRKIGNFAHAAWAATILGGAACADDAQLAADVAQGRTPHEIELRCREAARPTAGGAFTSRATIYMWTAAYVAHPPAPCALPWYHRAPPPREASVSLVLLAPDPQPAAAVTAWVSEMEHGRVGDSLRRLRAAARIVCDAIGQTRGGPCAADVRRRLSQAHRRLTRAAPGVPRTTATARAAAAVRAALDEATSPGRAADALEAWARSEADGTRALAAAAAALLDAAAAAAPSTALRDAPELYDATANITYAFAPDAARPVRAQAAALCAAAGFEGPQDCATVLASDALRRWLAQHAEERTTAMRAPQVFAALASRARHGPGALGRAARPGREEQKHDRAAASLPLSQLALGVRFDVVIKAAFAACYADALGLRAGGPPEEAAPKLAFLREAYARSLRGWNGCVETCPDDAALATCVAKASCDDFVDQFEALVVAVAAGSDVPPVALHWGYGGDASGERPVTLRDGAHRAAARFALAPRDRGDATIDTVLGPPLASGAMAWWRAAGLEAAERDFARRGGARADADALAALLGWIEGDGFGGGPVVVFVLWDAALRTEGARDAWTGVLRAARADLVASREVALTRQGAEALVEHAYGPTTWLAYKVETCFPGVLRGEETFAVKVDVARVPSRAWAQEAKAAFRGWWSDRNPSGDAKAAVHATDGRADARALGGLLLSPHSLALVNGGDVATARTVALRLASALRGAPHAPRAPWLDEAVALHRVVVDAGAAVAAWGVEGLPTAFEVDVIGDSDDLGALVAAPKALRLDDHGAATPWFDAHHGDLDPATLVHDPTAHAMVFGARFLTPELLARAYARRADANASGDAEKAPRRRDALRAWLVAHAPAWGAPALPPGLADDDAPAVRVTAEVSSEDDRDASKFTGGAFW